MNTIKNVKQTIELINSIIDFISYLQGHPIITILVVFFIGLVYLIFNYFKNNQYIVIVTYKEVIIMNRGDLYHLIKPYENKQNLNLDDLLFLIDLYRDNFVK